MPRLRIKICGITNASDAKQAVCFGADALGFIRYPHSPRFIEPDAVAQIIKILPPLVSTLAVFVDAKAADIVATLEVAPVSALQFHGQESEAECLCWGKPYVKTVKVTSADDVLRAVSAYPSASALLLDNVQVDKPGGTGEVFDWQQIPNTSKPLILAGGLNSTNIADAVSRVRPFGVDVCSGVEAAPGIKDATLMQAFIERAQAA